MDQIQEIQKVIRKRNPQSLIEVGCSFGRLCGKLQEANPDIKITGVDIAKGYIDRAKKNLPKVSFKRVDIVNEKLKGKWDIVCTHGLFIHIPHEEIEKAIKKVMKLGKIGIFLESEYPEEKKPIRYRPREYWERRVGQQAPNLIDANTQYYFLHNYKKLFKKLGIKFKVKKDNKLRLYICQ